MYGISPSVADDTDPMRVYHQSGSPAMNMGSMLPLDGEEMDYKHGVPQAYNYAQAAAMHGYHQQHQQQYEGQMASEEGYEGEDTWSGAGSDESGSYAQYDEDEAGEEYYEENPSYAIAQSPLAVMPPIGNWYKALTVEDQERELRRTIANRNNFVSFPLHMLFRVKELGAKEWKLSDVFKKGGEHAPYMYKGSPFHDDRTINSIYLRDASNGSPVSVDLTASLVHPSSNKEIMTPIVSFISSGNENGPSHLYLRPKETSDKEVLLWKRDRASKIPQVVLENPGATRKDLVAGLNPHPSSDKKLRTLSRDHLLIRYVKELMDMGEIPKDKNPVDWRKYEGYGVINAHRANTLIDKFSKDQSKVLSLRNIWDLRIKLSSGVGSNSGSAVDACNAELISEVPVFSHDKKSEVESYITRLKSIPYNLHWTVQVELEPDVNVGRK